MKNLFTYGTLMCEDIMACVSGGQFTQVPGTLRGYQRRSVKEEHYPAITRSNNNQVAGIIYRDISPHAWPRLDRFEGDMYARTSVQVELSEGKLLPAETYVVRPEFTYLLAQSDWDFAHFLKNNKESFMSGYKGYQSI